MESELPARSTAKGLGTYPYSRSGHASSELPEISISPLEYAVPPEIVQRPAHSQLPTAQATVGLTVFALDAASTVPLVLGAKGRILGDTDRLLAATLDLTPVVGAPSCGSDRF